MNHNVPPETLLRYVIKEKRALQLEVERLQAEIECKDRAIADFKKWQSRVAKYKFDYWLSEGMKLMEEQPEEKRFKDFRRLVLHYERFNLNFRLAEHNYGLVQEDREKLNQRQR